MHTLIRPGVVDAQAAFCGQVTRVRHDAHGNRITFLKVLQGTLHAKDEVRVGVQEDGKARRKRWMKSAAMTHSSSRPCPGPCRACCAA